MKSETRGTHTILDEDAEGVLNTNEMSFDLGVRISHTRGSARKTVALSLEVQEGFQTLLINRVGSLLAYLEADQALHIVPPESVAYCRGPAKAVLNGSRGDHEWIMIVWELNETHVLTRWVNAIMRQRNVPRDAGLLASSHVPPKNRETFERLVSYCLTPNPMRLPAIIAGIFETVGLVLSSDGHIVLATLPADVPDTLLPLLKSVKKQPSKTWSLKDAATLVGYSPFHLSRTFKERIGYGFPEFVDRCRTEIAVRSLSRSETSVDEVAQQSGFGSTHGLRESLKEYLGLLPSELRSLPQAPGSGIVDTQEI